MIQDNGLPVSAVTKFCMKAHKADDIMGHWQFEGILKRGSEIQVSTLISSLLNHLPSTASEGKKRITCAE